jgi:hypothetical protein
MVGICWQHLTTVGYCWERDSRRNPPFFAGCLSWLQRSVPTRMADRCRRRAAHSQAKGQQWVVLERYNVLHWTWVHFARGKHGNLSFLVKVAGLRMWHYKNYFWANPWCKALDDDDRNLSPPLSTSFSTLPFRDFSCIPKVWNNSHSHVRSYIVCVLYTVYHRLFAPFLDTWYILDTFWHIICVKVIWKLHDLWFVLSMWFVQVTGSDRKAPE